MTDRCKRPAIRLRATLAAALLAAPLLAPAGAAAEAAPPHPAETGA